MEELDEIKQEIIKREEIIQPTNIFEKNKVKEAEKPVPVDKNNKLVNTMLEDAITYQVANNQSLQDKVLKTAETYVETEMKIAETNVDTKNKEAHFNNKKDACESYGFNEKTTPIWATKFMSVGYSIMLAIWLAIGSITFMPIIFIAKKISVGLKKTWLAVLFAIILYLGITFVPILLAIIKS